MTERKRPLRGSGITGANQIITIIDSGLDINNKYFGPTSNSVYNVSIHSLLGVIPDLHTAHYFTSLIYTLSTIDFQSNGITHNVKWSTMTMPTETKRKSTEGTEQKVQAQLQEKLLAKTTEPMA